MNQPPVSDAGLDQRVLVGETVQLGGSGSSDPDGDPLSYSWSFVSIPDGSTVTLSDPTVVNPTFVAGAAGEYVIQLNVNDGLVDSDPDQVTITVQTPVEATQHVIDEVIELVTEVVLNQGQGNALTAKLDAAIRKTGAGENTVSDQSASGIYQSSKRLHQCRKALIHTRRTTDRGS